MVQKQATLTVHDAHSVSSENPIEPCEVPSATQSCPWQGALETLDYSCSGARFSTGIFPQLPIDIIMAVPRYHLGRLENGILQSR